MSETDKATAMLIGRTGAVAGRDYVVGDQARIGAGRDAEVRIRTEGISRVHARIWRDEDEYWIEDAGSTNGTFLGGVRIRKDRIRHLDVVTLGRAVDLIFVRRAGAAGVAAVPGAAASPPRVAAAALEPLDGPGGGAPTEIPKGEITLGRAVSNNIVIASRAVSKVHARIERTSGGVFIQDLGSANGTTVNGGRIEARTALAHGDRIVLAGVHGFRVSIEGKGEDGGDQTVSEPQSGYRTVFSQEWRTRLVWSADELEEMPVAPPELPEPPPPAEARQRPRQPKPLAPKRTPLPESPPEPKARRQAPPAAVKAPAAAPKADERSGTPPEPRAAPKPPPPLPPAVPRASEASEKAAKPKDAPKPEKPAKAPPRAPVDREAVAAFETVLAGSPAAADAPPAVRLVGAETHTLDAGATTIGRSVAAAVWINDRAVSRIHATITVTAEEVAIEDGGSANGTVVNGARIAGRTRLENGDRVKIGDLEWTVEVAGG